MHVFMRSLPGYVQDTLSLLKTDNLEVLGKEADSIKVLPRKFQGVVCTIQQPQAEQDILDGTKEELPAVHQLE